MDNRVIHFEIQADDIDRASNFYQKVLGWKIKQAMTKDQGGMDYWTLDTGSGPGISGGMYKRPSDPKEGNKHYLYDCTITVPDIDKAIAAVKANGGSILRDKTEMKGLGFFARAKDPEGNLFGLMQPTDWQPK